MARSSVPILTRSLEAALRTHPSRLLLDQLAGFADRVLAYGRPLIGVALTGDLSLVPRLELVVVLNQEAVDGPAGLLWHIGTGEAREPIEIGLRWWSYEKLARQPWPEGVKHALSQGLLLWDRDALLHGFLENRLWYPDALRCHRLLDNSIRIDELLSDSTLSTWVNRGELLQAHQLLSTALERVIDHLFDFHQVWRPPAGARLTALQGLDWLPPHFERRLEAAMRIDALTRDAVLERKAALEALFEPLQARVEAESWWPEQPHEHWRATVGGM
jgi:hypothetical protein